MGAFASDVRYGLRILRKDLGFTIVAVLTLALGIGANTAIFSFVNGVLLRPLPYANPGQLVRVFTVLPTQPHFPIAVADYYDYRDRLNIFSSSALYAERDLDLTSNDRPEHLSGMGVTHDYFSVLGVHPALGRDFDAKEELKTSGHVVILSDHLWRDNFNSDPNIVGKGILLSGLSFTVIGVMPPGVQHVGGDFHSPAHGDTVDFWWPFQLLPHDAEGCDRGCHYLNMVARLAPGVTPAEASAAMNAASAQLAKEHPGNAHQVLIVPLKEEIVGRARLMLWVLMGAVGFLLLIACVNVANIALSRATGRGREIAVRSVLGAGALRIIRQLLTESLLVAFFGCALGILFAIWGVYGLIAVSPDKMPRLQAVHIDGQVLLFAVGVSVVTALLFGLAPALAIIRSDVSSSLKDGDRGSTAGGSRGRIRNLLVVTEMALALMLLAGAGLLLRTFVNLEHVNMGFNPERVLTFQTDLPGKRYPNPEDFARFYQNLSARLQALPGVQSVGFGSDIPWTGYDENTDFEIIGRAPDKNTELEARYHFASPGYFESAGIPLISGRLFSLADEIKSPKVMVVNYAFERRYFPNEGAIGRHLNLWGFNDVQIVGVVGDVKDSPDAPATKPSLYWPDWQFSDQGARVGVIRANSNLTSLVGALRTQVSGLDKDLPVTDIKPMDDIAAHAVSTARFTWMLVAVFAALALILAAIGIFGVMSYSVTQRTHEIGIRMALGAQKDNVLSMIVRQGARLAAVGVVAGLLGSLALTRAMRGLLYGIGLADPWTFLAVSGVLVVVALAACYLPALRASEVDPIVALRHE
jgi:predicted permease